MKEEVKALLKKQRELCLQNATIDYDFQRDMEFINKASILNAPEPELSHQSLEGWKAPVECYVPIEIKNKKDLPPHDGMFLAAVNNFYSDYKFEYGKWWFYHTDEWVEEHNVTHWLRKSVKENNRLRERFYNWFTIDKSAEQIIQWLEQVPIGVDNPKKDVVEALETLYDAIIFTEQEHNAHYIITNQDKELIKKALLASQEQNSSSVV